MELYEIAIKNSNWVWNRLREARDNNFQIGEESLTDFVILNLKKDGEGKISVDTFTRNKESLTGADWEWWFTGPSGKWLGMRVQAKVINLKNEAFEHIHYKNSHGYQVDTLVKDAAKNNLIPLYCMYTNWQPHKYKPTSICNNFNSSIRHFGMSLLNPHHVTRLRPEKSLSTIIKYLHPLHCIFCCGRYGGTDLPTKALAFSNSMELIPLTNSEKEGSVSYLKDRPPYYVSQLLEGELEDDFIDLHDENIKRVTVIKELQGD